MDAYSIEILQHRGWRRERSIYWTLDDANKAGAKLIRRKVARQVRIFKINFGAEAVVSLPASEANT